MWYVVVVARWRIGNVTNFIDMQKGLENESLKIKFMVYVVLDSGDLKLNIWFEIWD